MNVVKYLIKLGADINKENTKKETPLFYACRNGNDELVDYLIGRGGDVNKKSTDEITPVWEARNSGHRILALYLDGLGIKYDPIVYD